MAILFSLDGKRAFNYVVYIRLLYIAPAPPKAVSYPLPRPNFPSLIPAAFGLSPALIYAILVELNTYLDVVEQATDCTRPA